MISPVIFANRLAVNTFNSDITKIISFLNLVIFSKGISREKVFRSQTEPNHVSLLEGSQTLFLSMKNPADSRSCRTRSAKASQMLKLHYIPHLRKLRRIIRNSRFVIRDSISEIRDSKFYILLSQLV